MCFPLFHWQSQAFWNSHYKLKHPFLDASQTALCAHQDPGEKSCDPTRDWPRLTCECPGVSGRDMDWRWPPAVLAALSAAVHAQNLLKEVAINLHYLHYSLVSGQTAEREHSPSHQQKIGLKIYWAWPRPSEQDRFPLSQSLPSGVLYKPLIFSIRGQTEWKPQSQKTNQTVHVDNSLV